MALAVGSGLRRRTHRGDSAGSRDGAHGTRGLSESVPEHIKGVCEDTDERGAIAARCNWERGDWRSRCCLLQESKWRFSGGQVMESRVCEGVGGAQLAGPTNKRLVRGFACKFRGCLNNVHLPGSSLRYQPPAVPGNLASF